MERILAIIGTVVFTSKTLYYVAGVGYILVSIGCLTGAYILDKTDNYGAIVKDCQSYEAAISALTQWILYTNIVALFSAIAFFYTSKGSTVSVLGSLFWIINFLQTIVLFIYAQVKIFDSDIRECKSNAAESNSSFVWQFNSSLAYIIVQYVKLAIIVAAILYFRCCVKAGTGKL